MGFCPYITANLITKSAVDGTTSNYTYSVSEYTCPQNNTCQVWDGSDCGSKNPVAAASGPNPTTLLTEFLNKTDSDNLDLSNLGVVTGDGIYGFDYMIDDEDIPIILKAAHDHPDWNDSTLLDRVSGTGNLDLSDSGYDGTNSSDDWIYTLTATAWDSTDDFTTSGVDAGSIVYMPDIPETDYKALTVTTKDSEIVLTINLGVIPSLIYPDKPITEDSYDFKIDRKRILWEEYKSLF